MSGLGRGLGSLIPKKPEEAMKSLEVPAVPQKAPALDGKALEVDIQLIDPNPYQPRTEFSADDLQELVESIKVHGVMQPPVVTKNGDRFQLIAGERRLRASKLAGLTKIPVVVRDWVDDRMKLELALIENIQRADLNPIEEALAYKQLMEEFKLTQEEMAKRVGKSRPAVANTLRLLNLPLQIQTALREKTITAGQARAILALGTADEQLELFRKITDTGMSARAVEDAVVESRVTTMRRDPNIMAYENELRHALGAKVRITEKNGRGKIVIEYFSREDLLELKKKLGSKM